MNCFNPKCNAPIIGNAFARHTRAGLLFFCSPGCKAGRTAANASSETPKTARRTGAERRKRHKPDISETQISRTIGADLKFFAPYSTRLQSGQLQITSGKAGKPYYVHLCEPGTPDRMAANGLIVFFEIKKKDKTAAAKQKEIHEILTRNGALCFTVDSIESYSAVADLLRLHAPEMGAIAAQIAELQAEIESKLKLEK